MKTINRGWLKKMVDAGKMEARVNSGEWMPASEMKFRASEFSSEVGRAWEDSGIITLKVHSRSSYYLRLVA
jgi:hypothetical protein